MNNSGSEPNSPASRIRTEYDGEIISIRMTVGYKAMADAIDLTLLTAP